MPSAMPMWYRFSISARESSSTPFGRPVVPPVYMRTTGSSSSGSVGTTGCPAATRSSYSASCGPSPPSMSTIWRIGRSRRTSAMLREVLGEHRVDEDDLGVRVGEDELQLLAGQAQVQRVGDGAAEERGVIELEVLVAVARHDGEAVPLPDAEVAVHRVGQPQHALAVLAERRGSRRRGSRPCRRTARTTAAGCDGRRVPSCENTPSIRRRQPESQVLALTGTWRSRREGGGQFRRPASSGRARPCHTSRTPSTTSSTLVATSTAAVRRAAHRRARPEAPAVGAVAAADSAVTATARAATTTPVPRSAWALTAARINAGRRTSGTATGTRAARHPASAGSATAAGGPGRLRPRSPRPRRPRCERPGRSRRAGRAAGRRPARWPASRRRPPLPERGDARGRWPARAVAAGDAERGAERVERGHECRGPQPRRRGRRCRPVRGWAAPAPAPPLCSTMAIVRSSAETACCWSSMRVSPSRIQVPRTRLERGNAVASVAPICCCAARPAMHVARSASGVAGRPAGLGLGDPPQPGERLAHHAVAPAPGTRRFGRAPPRAEPLAHPTHLRAEVAGLLARRPPRRRSAARRRGRSSNATVSARP